MLKDFKPTIGFKTTFELSFQNKTFVHSWLVTSVEKSYKISYIWRFDNYTGASNSSFLLKKTSTGSQLSLIIKILEDFTADVPEFKRKNCIIGTIY